MKPLRLLIFALAAAVLGVVVTVVLRSMETPDETIPFDASKPSKFKMTTNRAASAGGPPAKKPASKDDKN